MSRQGNDIGTTDRSAIVSRDRREVTAPSPWLGRARRSDEGGCTVDAVRREEIACVTAAR
jgi:hypothetical protein